MKICSPKAQQQFLFITESNINLKKQIVIFVINPNFLLKKDQGNLVEFHQN